MNEFVREWVAKSEDDWRSAQVLLKETSPLVMPALFHMQQCAEKLLKAILIKKEIAFERRHDLSYLVCLTDEPLLLDHSLLLIELNPFAVEFRYPGDLPQFSSNEALQMLNRLGQFRETLFPLIDSSLSK